MNRIIAGEPLSLDEVVEGMFYWLKDYDGKKKNVILGNETQDPNLLLYKDKIKAYVVRIGGYLSHLAIVCRELNIPCYVISEEINSGDYIMIIPKKLNLRVIFPK